MKIPNARRKHRSSQGTGTGAHRRHKPFVGTGLSARDPRIWSGGGRAGYSFPLLHPAHPRASEPELSEPESRQGGPETSGQGPPHPRARPAAPGQEAPGTADVRPSLGCPRSASPRPANHGGARNWPGRPQGGGSGPAGWAAASLHCTATQCSPDGTETVTRGMQMSGCQLLR